MHVQKKNLLGGVLHFWKQIRKSANMVRRYSEANKIEKVAWKKKKKTSPAISVTPYKRLENQNEDGKTEINSGYTRWGLNDPTIKTVIMVTINVPHKQLL
jgi:hypothetical protein